MPEMFSIHNASDSVQVNNSTDLKNLRTDQESQGRLCGSSVGHSSSCCWSASDSKSAKSYICREFTSLDHFLRITLAQHSDCHVSGGRCNQCTYHGRTHMDHFLAFASRCQPWPNVMYCINCHILPPCKNTSTCSRKVLSAFVVVSTCMSTRRITLSTTSCTPRSCSQRHSRMITLKRTGYILDRCGRSVMQSPLAVQGPKVECILLEKGKQILV